MAAAGGSALASLAIGLSVLFAIFLAALAAEIYYMLCCSPSSASASSPLKRRLARSHRRRVNSVQVVDAARKVAILENVAAAGWPLQSPAFFSATKSSFYHSSASSPLRYDRDHDLELHHDHFLLSTQPYGFLFTIAEETKEEMELQLSGQLVVNVNMVGGSAAPDASSVALPAVSSPVLSSCVVVPISPTVPVPDPAPLSASAPISAAQMILARRSAEGSPLISGGAANFDHTTYIPNWGGSGSDQANAHCCYSPDSACSGNHMGSAGGMDAVLHSHSDRIISKTASPGRLSGGASAGSPPSSSNSSDTPFLTPLSSPADAEAAALYHHHHHHHLTTLMRSRSTIQYSASPGRFHTESPSEAASSSSSQLRMPFSPGVDPSYMYDDHGTLGALFRCPYSSPSRYSPLRPTTATAWSGRITDFRKWKVFHNSLSLS